MYNVHVYTTCTIESHILCLHLHIHTHVGKGGWIFFCFKETLYLGGFIFCLFFLIVIWQNNRTNLLYILPYLPLICT